MHPVMHSGNTRERSTPDGGRPPNSLTIASTEAVISGTPAFRDEKVSSYIHRSRRYGTYLELSRSIQYEDTEWWFHGTRQQPPGAFLHLEIGSICSKIGAKT